MVETKKDRCKRPSVNCPKVAAERKAKVRAKEKAAAEKAKKKKK